MASCIVKNKNGVPPEHDIFTNYIVVVGDEGIGKTSLIEYFINDEHRHPYALLIFSMYTFTYIRPNSETGYAAFGDLPPGYGAEDRKISYPSADVVLACFAIDDPLSLEHVSTTWIPEIRATQEHSSPIMLVGLKKDLRTDPSVVQRLQEEGSSLVTEDQARAVVENLHLSDYVECSARTGDGTQKIYEDALRLFKSPSV